MMAWSSFVFAILTGICIGAISLSTIIGIAYVNKKANLATLVFLACFFEAIGMLTMSRFTLDLTVRKTIPVDKISNLRLGFIVLGTTQMCSALILVNVLIFALPMSTTQVVISGLTGVSIIFFSAFGAELRWFLIELGLWIVCPILGMLLAYFAKRMIEKHILNHEDCRKRVLIMTPYYMTGASYMMIAAPLTKNYIHNHDEASDMGIKVYTSFYIIYMSVSPIIFLIIFRFMLIRRARNVEVVKLKRQLESTKQKRKSLFLQYGGNLDQTMSLTGEELEALSPN